VEDNQAMLEKELKLARYRDYLKGLKIKKGK